jgi:hypothetical protein
LNILNLKKDHLKSNLKTDICIVGSGPAGCILAIELAKKKNDILLIESSNKLSEFTRDSISYNSTINDSLLTSLGWFNGLGGSSNLWAGRISSFESIDFIDREWIPNSGWPIDYKTYSFYLNEAYKLIEKTEYNYLQSIDDIRCSLNINDKFKMSFLESLKYFIWSKKPFNARDYLLENGKSLKNLTILSNAPVNFLYDNLDNNHIDCLSVKPENKKEFKVFSKKFILATGGIETPRLLLNSSIKNRRKIGNKYVGKFFSTHPKGNIAILNLYKKARINNPLFIDSKEKNINFRLGVGLSEKQQFKYRTLNHYFQLTPLLEHQANKAFEFIKSYKILDNPLFNRPNFIKGYLPGLFKIFYNNFRSLCNLQLYSKSFVMRGFFDQYPNINNCLTLSDQKKNDGTFKININWVFSELDKKSVIHSLEIINKSLKANNLGQIDFGNLQRNDSWNLQNIHSHFMGSTRMGKNQSNAVTNQNGQVYGFDNLFISGPSLFPTYGYANPFLSIAAIALMQADHINYSLNNL